MPLMFGGTGVIPDLRGNPSNVISLRKGETYELPNDWFMVQPGPFTTVQEYDPITTLYRKAGAGPTAGMFYRTKGDGNNYRLANLTGCIIGATVITAGSGYTTPPVVTDNASTGAVYKAIIGGAVNTSVTVTNGGSNYTYNPVVLFQAPPPGGVQATGHCTLSNGGAVATVVVDDQGAGYVSAPTVTFVNDPREGYNGVTVGSGAAAQTTLTGAGTVTAVLVLDPGLPVANRSTLPTLSFSTGSAAATAIMDWSIISYNVSATTAGSGYAAPVIISGYDTAPAGSAITNPTIQDNLVAERRAFIVGALSGAAITATGQTVLDGGVYLGVPTLFAYGFVAGASPVQVVFLNPTMGGVSDTSLVFTT